MALVRRQRPGETFDGRLRRRGWRGIQRLSRRYQAASATVNAATERPSGKNEEKTTVKILDGINHVAIITDDLDRLVDFYVRMFDAYTVLDLKEDNRRSVLIDVGGCGVLSAFQLTDVKAPKAGCRGSSGAGRPVCLNAASEAAVRELRRRLLVAGATDGVVTDVGPALQLSFPPVSGGFVIWHRPALTG